MPEKRYTKVEEEILQILDKMEVDRELPSRPPLRIVRQPTRSQRFVGVKRFLNQPWIPLAMSALLAFLAVMFSDSHTVATLLAIASMLAFLSPIVLRRTGGRSVGPEQYGTKLWRGQDISLDPPRSNSSADRARDWLDRRRRNGR